jgi:hypothetical protein
MSSIREYELHMSYIEVHPADHKARAGWRDPNLKSEGSYIIGKQRRPEHHASYRGTYRVRFRCRISDIWSYSHFLVTKSRYILRDGDFQHAAVRYDR